MSDNTREGICQLQHCDEEVVGEFEYYEHIRRRILCFGYCKDHIKIMFGKFQENGDNPRMREHITITPVKVEFT